jgi:Ran GTPase-activating protein (RanGAP) involved in mRNA processing and transport
MSYEVEYVSDDDDELTASDIESFRKDIYGLDGYSSGDLRPASGYGTSTPPSSPFSADMSDVSSSSSESSRRSTRLTDVGVRRNADIRVVDTRRVSTPSELAMLLSAVMRQYTNLLHSYTHLLKLALDSPGKRDAPKTARDLYTLARNTLSDVRYYKDQLVGIDRALSGRGVAYFSDTIVQRVYLNDPFIQTMDISRKSKYYGVDPNALVVHGNLGENTNIRVLNMSGLKFSRASYVNKLAKALSKNSTMVNVELYDMNIGNRGVNIIAGAFYHLGVGVRNRTVTHLNLGGNYRSILGSDRFSTRILANMIARNSTITHLALPGLDIESNGLNTLVEGLLLNNTIIELDISNNPVGSHHETGGFGAFGRMLSENTTIESLIMAGCFLDRYDLNNLVQEATATHNVLSQLDISGNDFSSEEAALEIADLIRNNGLITMLNINSCGLTSAGMQSVFVAMVENPVIVNLDAGANRIDYYTGEAIGLALTRSKQIRHLDISSSFAARNAWFRRTTEEDRDGNTVTTSVGIAVGLARNDSIISLNVAGNIQMGVDGAGALGAALTNTGPISKAVHNNRTLQSISFRNCLIGPEGTVAFSVCLRSRNNALTTLDMSGCAMMDNGLVKLVEAILVYNRIEKLVLESNLIGMARRRNTGFDAVSTVGARSIAKLIGDNASLTHLDLRKNVIGNDSAGILSESLRHTTSLTYLDLSENNLSDEYAGQIVDNGLDRNGSIVEFNIDSREQAFDRRLRSRIDPIIERNKFRGTRTTSLVSLAMSIARQYIEPSVIEETLPGTLIERSEAKRQRASSSKQ